MDVMPVRETKSAPVRQCYVLELLASLLDGRGNTAKQRADIKARERRGEETVNKPA